MFLPPELSRARQTNSELKLPAEVTVSKSLLQTMGTAAKSLPAGRDVVTEDDLLLAMASGKGKAVEFLQIAAATAPSDLDHLKNALLRDRSANEPQEVGAVVTNTERIKVDRGLRNAIAVGMLFSTSGAVGTKEILTAQAYFASSALARALSSLGVARPQAILTELVRQTSLTEDSPQLVRFEAGEQPVNVLPQEKARQTTPAGKDLLKDARSEAITTETVWPDQLFELIQSSTSNQLTVIISASRFEADCLVRDLADSVTADTEKLLQFKGVIEADSAMVSEDPEKTVGELVRMAAGGAVYFGDSAQNKLLIGSNDSPFGRITGTERPKIILAMTDRDWRTVSARPVMSKAKIVRLPALTIEQARAVLNQRRAGTEAKYGMSLTDSGLAELARVITRFGVDVDDLLTVASEGIRLGSSEVLRKRLRLRFESDRKIDALDVDLALRTITGIVVSPENRDRYVHMEEELKTRVVGQDEAIAAISEAIRREKAGLKDPNKPIGVFIFIGPTGVGKTETARALAKFLFDDERAITEIDMSEYQEKHTISRLIGAPPGYVGHEEGGQLTEAVRQRPYSVVVWDEFEKASPDILKLGLQINEAGRLTDGLGQSVDFSNTVIIYTGNVAAELFPLIGTADDSGRTIDAERVKTEAINEMRRLLPPEFLNRIDNVVVFNRLSRENLTVIADIQLAKLEKRLADQEIKLEVSGEAKKLLVDRSYDPNYGARPLIREINASLVSQLSTQILQGGVKPGDSLVVAVQDGKLIVTKKGT